MTIQELTKMILKFRDERKWESYNTPKDSALALVAEVGELIEHFKWHTTEEMHEYMKTHKKDIGEELCDVLFWVLLIAHDCNIDLLSAFPEKMKKNEAKYPAEKYQGGHS